MVCCVREDTARTVHVTNLNVVIPFLATEKCCTPNNLTMPMRCSNAEVDQQLSPKLFMSKM